MASACSHPADTILQGAVAGVKVGKLKSQAGPYAIRRVTCHRSLCLLRMRWAAVSTAVAASRQ